MDGKKQIATVSTWYGRPIDELERHELIEVIEFCGKEIQKLRNRDKWRDCADPLKYLKESKN